MGEFTLTDNIRLGEGKLSPSVFLCLAQLQNPLKPLFPNLRRLRIDNADYSLDYLRLFLSPSLETLEIAGLGEACRPALLSFLSAAVVEVPNLSTLILGPGRLSRSVVDACLGFDRLKHLELVDVVSEVDYQFLKNIGRLEHLETFVVDAQGVGYVPSPAILQDEDERTRLVVDESCRQKFEEAKRESRQRFEEQVEERQRKAELPRKKGVCWMCRKRFQRKSKTQCSSCSQKILEQDQYIQEMKDERCQLEEQRRLEMECGAKAGEGPRVSSPECKSGHGCTENSDDLFCEKADVTDRLDSSNLRRIDHPRTYKSGAQDSSDPREKASHRMFPKLLEVTIHACAEVMQDLVELIDSSSIVFLSLNMVPVQPSPSSTPSRRFVATIDFALRCWAGTISHVTLSGLPGGALKLPDETVEALVRLPQLEYLELNGWDTVTDYLCRLEHTNSSKLKVLHLPNNKNSMPLSKLRSIAEAFPNLLSLRCRINNPLDIPHQSVSGVEPLSHSLKTLIVGDTHPPLDFEAVLDAAQYIDDLFPKIKDIKPLEGTAQNTEQWRRIEKLVKFRQSGRTSALALKSYK